MNEFNRKKEIPGSVIKIVHNRTNREGRRIKKIVKVLRDKFKKTFAEKTKDMIEKMMNLVNKNIDESGEQTWDNFYSLKNKMKIEDLKQIKCRKKFRFRPGKVHNSEFIYELPIMVKNYAYEEDLLWI